MRSLAAAAVFAVALAGGLACAPEPLAVFTPAPLAFDRCPVTSPIANVAGAECAALEVPRDWDDVGGARITLDVARLRATEASGARVGVVTFDFGGPGIPAIPRLAALDGVGLAGEGDDVVSRFDRVAMTRRGVGLHCISDALAVNLDAAPRAPEDHEAWQRVFAVEHAIADACTGVDAELLAHVDVESAARDTDALRAALGEEKLNMVASSEGTRVAAEVATLFPDRVRAFVLDSPALADDEGHRHVADQALGFDDAFERFFQWCASVPVDQCPLHPANETPDQIAASFDALVQLLDRVPVNVDGVHVDGGLLVDLLVDASFAPDELWGTLATVAERAVQGDAAGIAQLSTFIDPDVDDAAFRAIGAVDRPFSPAEDDAGLEQFAAELATDAPRGAARAARTEAGNAVWPIRAARRPAFIGPSTAPPLLLLATRHDVATPELWAERMQQALDNGSHLVVYEGDGHTRAPDVDCLGKAGVAFLLDPTTAPVTTSCPE